MMQFSVVKKNKVNAVFLSLLIISVLMMSLDVRNRGKLSIFDEFFLDTASVLQRGITYSFQAVRDAWSGYIYLVNLRDENLALRTEVSELKERVNELEEASQENLRFRELLAFRESTGYSTQTARVIGLSPSNLFKTITISKGRKEGIKKGMTVLTNDGIVGRILSTSDNSAKVLLVTDRNSDVDAILQRSRDRGIAEGNDSEFLQFKYLHRNADAAEGDLVITSGVAGVFQKGLVIGTISRLEKKGSGLFQYAEITPSVNFTKLEEVLVITDPQMKHGL